MKITKLEALVLWNGLRGVPPSEFKSMKEIKVADELIDKFRDLSSPLSDNVLEVEEKLRDMTEEQARQTVKDFNLKASKLERKHGSEEVETEIDKNAVFGNFLDRWIKYWFKDVHSLVAFADRIGYNLGEQGQEGDSDTKQGR